MTTRQPRPWKKWELGVFTGVAVLAVGGLGLWLRGNLGPETAPSTLGAASRSKGDLHVLLHRLVAEEGQIAMWSQDKLDETHTLLQQKLQEKLSTTAGLVLHSPEVLPAASDKAVALRLTLLVYTDEKNSDVLVYEFKIKIFKWVAGEEKLLLETPLEQRVRATLGNGKTKLSASYEDEVIHTLIDLTTNTLLKELPEL